MNKTLNPCDDFYNYACAGWEINFPLSKNEDVLSFDKMTEYDAKFETKGTDF